MNHEEAITVKRLAEQITKFDNVIKNIRKNGIISTVEGSGVYDSGLRFTTQIKLNHEEIIEEFVALINRERELNELTIASIITGEKENA